VSPVAGRDYPRSYAAELRAWFNQDAKCLDYLDWLRWPDGFVCPGCGSLAGWRLSDARWLCGVCKRKVSATAGTILDKTRTPLTVWFTAAWLLVNSKTGVSATQLRREMELVDPDRVGDAASVPHGDGATRAGPVAWRCRS